MLLGLVMVLSYPVILCVEIGLILFCGYPEIFSRDIETLLFVFMLVGCAVTYLGVLNIVEEGLKF